MITREVAEMMLSIDALSNARRFRNRIGFSNFWKFIQYNVAVLNESLDEFIYMRDNYKGDSSIDYTERLARVQMDAAAVILALEAGTMSWPFLSDAADKAAEMWLQALDDHEAEQNQGGETDE